MSNTELVKQRPLPTIISIGNREVISTGQFVPDLVAEKIIRDGINEWVSISDLAKFAYGKSFLANNQRVRGYIWKMRRDLLVRGFLLIAEGRPIEHVKIFVGSGQERQLAKPLLAKMRKRSDISAELYEKAIGLFAEAHIEEKMTA